MNRNVSFNMSAGELSADAVTEYRLPSTAYSVGDRRYAPNQPGFLLICSTAGTTSANDLATLTDATVTVTDGQAIWAVRSMNVTIPAGVTITADVQNHLMRVV